ncbi:MAG: hypothetical protein ACI37T_05765 [Candidatus Gastranaerophilaceae bacterium]
MTSPISSITNLNIVSSYIAAENAKMLSAVTNLTKKRLEEYGVDVDKIQTEDEALAILEEKELEEAKQTEQLQSSQNSETYYDKQIMSDALDLASDLGLYFDTSIDLETLMENIQNRLAELKSAVSDNENLNKVVDEYSNRYDYIYSQYMDKKSVLSAQLIASVEISGLNNIAGI